MRAPAWLTARPIAHRGLHDRSRGVMENMPAAVSAAVEGGYLLSQTAHDPRLMQTSLNAAIAHIMSFAPDSSERASR